MAINTNKDIGQRIKIVLMEKGVKQTDFADELDIYYNTFNDIIQGRRAFVVRIIPAIVKKFPDLNARWLLTGEGEMFFEHENPLLTTIEEQAKQISTLLKVVDNLTSE